MKYFLPHQTIVMLSNALVIPTLIMVAVCGQISQLISITNYRFFTITWQGLYFQLISVRTPINEMMDALKWFKLDKRWHDQLLLIVFKCLRKLSPSQLSSQFEFVHDSHSHLTRSHTVVILWLYLN